MNEISRKPAHTVTELASGKRPSALHVSTRKTRPAIMERAVEGNAEKKASRHPRQ